MSGLLTSDVHVDRALSNISISFAQDSSRFIATSAFPTVGVDRLTDKYYIFDRANYLRSVAGLRAEGSKSRRANPSISTAAYSCEEYSLDTAIDDKVEANADAALNLQVSMTQYLTEQILMSRETAFANAAFATGVWTGSSTGSDIATAQLSNGNWDTAGSTPVFDLLRELASVESKTGRRPNVVVLGYDVWTALQTNSDFLTRIQGSQLGIVTLDLLAAILNVEKVVVPSALKNTGLEGGTENTNYIFNPKDAAMYYAAPAPGLMTPTAGYHFAFNSIAGTNGQGLRVRKYRDESISSQVIQVQAFFDFKVVSQELGAFFTGVVS